MLHAFPLGPEMWAPKRDTLEGHEVLDPILYELEGNSIAGWAEQIWDGFDDDFAAVGLSMGGYVALALARLAGERSRGLFLAGARVGADDADRRAARNAAIETLREQGIDAWAPSAPAPPPPERTVEELIRATEALRDRRDSTDFVSDYERPLWVVAGSVVLAFSDGSPSVAVNVVDWRYGSGIRLGLRAWIARSAPAVD